MLLPCFWLYSDVFLSRTVKGLGEADDEEESAANGSSEWESLKRRRS